MSDLERRGGGRMTRKQREQRAYRLTIATGGLTVAAIAALVLSIAGVLGGGWVVLLVIMAVLSGWMLRRTLQP
jgi:hypothetical protein